MARSSAIDVVINDGDKMMMVMLNTNNFRPLVLTNGMEGCY